MSMKKYWLLVFLILLGIIPLFSLLTPGLPITHDGKDHVARIANFYLNLTEGNVIPRWAPLLNWGYGHPILMFLYPFPSYLASFFHAVGFSLVDSLKLVFALTFVASGLTMYIFVSSMFGRNAGFLAGMLYMYAPYRFVDLYVRGAVGEHVAFVFPPLVCYFLFQLTKNRNPLNVVLGALSLAGLLLSHNAVSLMFIPIFLLLGIYFLWQVKDRKFYMFQALVMIFCGVLLSGFFLIPAFLEGKYTLRDIVTDNEYASRFETVTRFIYSPWSFDGTNRFSVQIGLVQWLIVAIQPVIAYVLYKRKQTKLLVFVVGIFVLFVLSLFIMTEPAKPVYEVFSVLQKFQFPWRFLTLSVFITAVMGGIFVHILEPRRQLVVLIVISVLLIFVNKDYVVTKGYLLLPDSFYKSVYEGTTDTGESAPIWSVRFMLEKPESENEVISGAANIVPGERTATTRSYEIIASSGARILENTLYFPGWKVFVNGQEAQVEFQDQNNRGLITYMVPSGKNDVVITFENTKLRNLSEAVSILGVIFLTIYVIFFNKFNKWKIFQ